MTEQAQYISGRTVQEQMDNLIKYVDDRSKTVAEEEAQRVLVPAENAKVAAEAAADRAVSSVGQFESRLGGVEDGVAGNRSSIQTIDGEITDIYNDLTNVVRKVGEAEQVVMNGLDLRGNNRTTDTVVGQLNNLIVNAKRLIEELNAYAPMLRTTGNQTKVGNLNLTSSGNTPTENSQNRGVFDISLAGRYAHFMSIKNSSMTASHAGNPEGRSWFYVNGSDDEPLFIIQFDCSGNSRSIIARIWNGNAWIQTTLASTPYIGD